MKQLLVWVAKFLSFTHIIEHRALERPDHTEHTITLNVYMLLAWVFGIWSYYFGLTDWLSFNIAISGTLDSIWHVVMVAFVFYTIFMTCFIAMLVCVMCTDIFKGLGITEISARLKRAFTFYFSLTDKD